MNIIYREFGYHCSVSLCLLLVSSESEACVVFIVFLFHSSLKIYMSVMRTLDVII